MGSNPSLRDKELLQRPRGRHHQIELVARKILVDGVGRVERDDAQRVGIGILQRFGDHRIGQADPPFAQELLKVGQRGGGILDGIIEMIYALDKIAPGTANDDTLLYGVEVKFYNMEVEIDGHLETKHKGLFVIGDCSGVTHSLSHASASGVCVARYLSECLA